MTDGSAMQDHARSSLLVRHSGPSDWVTSLAVSGDGALLATGGLFDSVYIWDMKAKALLHTFNPDNPEEYLQGIDQVEFHASLPYLAYLEGQGTVCVARTDTWKRVATLADTESCAMVFAFDCRLPRIA